MYKHNGHQIIYIYFTARTAALFQGKLKSHTASTADKLRNTLFSVPSCDVIWTSYYHQQTGMFSFCSKGDTDTWRVSSSPKICSTCTSRTGPWTLSLWLKINSHTSHEVHHTKLGSFTPAFGPQLPTKFHHGKCPCQAGFFQIWRHFKFWKCIGLPQNTKFPSSLCSPRLPFCF